MDSPTEEKEKLYNRKWEFTFNVREPCPTVYSANGQIRVRKVVMIQREGKPVVIEVSGPLHFAPYNGAGMTRSVKYSLDGKLYPMPPDWIIEAVRIAGFGREEP